MMTGAEFAYYAMRIASRASSWAADCMTPGLDHKITREAADRFLKDQRSLLDLIERETRS